MRYQFTLVSILAAVFMQASAVSATTLSAAFGASVPVDPAGLTLIEKGGPSRANGGEHFTLHLSAAKMITEIKLTSFSTGHAGKSLIHSATGTAGTTAVSLDGLSQFAKVTPGNGDPVNYENLVMLPDTTFVQVAPNQAFSQLDFVIEGFTNDDASLLLQITSSDTINTQDFLLTRTGPMSGETLGGMINEATFAKFTAANLQSLMTIGTDPTGAILVGNTFACSSYTKLNNAQIDFKKRTYLATPAGAILSDSDLEGSNLPWTPTASGLEMTIDNANGCGKFATTNVLRKTPAGNLISEVVLNLNNYLALCTAAGYDAAGIAAVESNSTFPSLVAPQYVVDSYEFCHLAK